MTDQATPAKVRLTDGLGPWSVSMLERPQPMPWFVCRQTGATQWEQLQRDDGCGIARFETMAEAQTAADAANTQGPNADVTGKPPCGAAEAK